MQLLEQIKQRFTIVDNIIYIGMSLDTDVFENIIYFILDKGY